MNGLQISAVILAVVFGLFDFFLAVSVAGTVTKSSRAVKKRVDSLQKTPSAVQKNSKRKESVLRHAKGMDISRSTKGRKVIDRLFDALISADIMMRPEEFAIVWIVVTFVPAGLVALFGAGVLPAVTLAGLGAFLPILYIRIKKEKRKRRAKNAANSFIHKSYQEQKTSFRKDKGSFFHVFSSFQIFIFRINGEQAHIRILSDIGIKKNNIHRAYARTAEKPHPGSLPFPTQYH